MVGRPLWMAGLVLGVVGAVVPGSVSAFANVNAGAVGLTWHLPGVSAEGVSNITFPMTVNVSTLHKDGTYFAQQFNFAHAQNVGYTGLQPRADRDGHPRLHAAFSSFIAGTQSTDSNCHNGADGGPGVSCATEFDAVYGHIYNLTVHRSGTDTWTGTATDTVTGMSSHIGTYTLPSGSGGIKGFQAGFVEYYLGTVSCDSMAHIDVTFGGPTSTDNGGLRGTTVANYEYHGCKGISGYSATASGTGTHVIRGFVGSGPVAPKPPTAPVSTRTSRPATTVLPRPTKPGPTTGIMFPSSGPAALPPDPTAPPSSAVPSSTAVGGDAAPASGPAGRGAPIATVLVLCAVVISTLVAALMARRRRQHAMRRRPRR